MTNKQFIKRFGAIKKRLEKDRDALRSLIDDAGDILATSERASESMEEAADSLSELL